MTANPADAVREALERLNDYFDWDMAAADAKGDWAIIRDRLAALAGAEAVAWHVRHPMHGDMGLTDDAETVAYWRKNGGEVTPLFTHAPAKAREVTDAQLRAVAELANDMDEGHRAEEIAGFARRLRAIFTPAALATFAEGGSE